MRLIDADALETNCRITGEFINNFECVSLATLKEIIDRQPTIDPVKHGEWLNDSGYDDWHCSECGFEINYDGEYPTEYEDYRFCGSCGAKMGEVEA